jgi:hypothetical protein
MDASALRVGRQMVARGERPLYHVRPCPDGLWVIHEAPWLTLHAGSRSEALIGARSVIVAWLEVAPDAFDVEPTE